MPDNIKNIKLPKTGDREGEEICLLEYRVAINRCPREAQPLSGTTMPSQPGPLVALPPSPCQLEFFILPASEFEKIKLFLPIYKGRVSAKYFLPGKSEAILFLIFFLNKWAIQQVSIKRDKKKNVLH